MVGEVSFALIGALFILAAIRTFTSALFVSYFGTLPNTTIGVIAVGVFAAALLAPLFVRVYAARRALALTSLALAASTVLATLSRIAFLDLLLTAVALIAGAWWLAILHASRPLGRPSPLPVALPLALVTDLALRQAFRTIPVVDLPVPLATLLVAVAALVFLASALASLPGDRSWTAPGPRGLATLAAIGPLLLVTETGATNPAQVALAGGLGWGPEPARAVQLGAIVIGIGVVAGAVVLTRDVRRRPIAALALALGAVLLWVHVPGVSLLGGALLAGGALVAASVLVTHPPAGGRGMAATAIPLAVGLVAFVALGFAYFALYTVIPAWIATALVAIAVLVAPPAQGPRLSVPGALLIGAIAIAVPIVALLPFRAPPDAGTKTSFRVMTYNVHQGFNDSNSPALDEITDTISREQPDVLVLQEVVRGWFIDEGHDVLSVLSERLDMPYVWGPNIGDLYGNAVLSKMPMTFVDRVRFPREAALRNQPRGALLVRVSDVLIVATHLDEHRADNDVRERQLREVLRAWNGATPALIVGDLNADPGDRELMLLGDSGFSDLAAAAGADQPTSYEGRRIDYVWGIGLVGGQAHTVDSHASDHKALVVNVTRTSR